MFGTHIVTEFTGGGKFQLSFATGSSYFDTMSQTDIQLNAKYNFLNLVGQSGGGGGTGRTVDQLWLNASILEYECLGGYGGCPTSTTFSEWTKSVFTNPWPLDVTMQSISVVMPHSIQLHFELAIINYLMKSYINNDAIPFLTNVIQRLNTIYQVNAQCNPDCHCSQDSCVPPLGIYVSTKSDFDANMTVYHNNLQKLISDFTDALNITSNLKVQKIVNSTKFIELTSIILKLSTQHQQLILNGSYPIVCKYSCEYYLYMAGGRYKHVHAVPAITTNVNAYIHSLK